MLVVLYTDSILIYIKSTTETKLNGLIQRSRSDEAERANFATSKIVFEESLEL